MSESLISFNVNFSNSGSGQTASTTSVEGTSRLSNNTTLGTIFAKKGDKPSFSKQEIDEILENFTVTEETRSEDATGKK